MRDPDWLTFEGTWAAAVERDAVLEAVDQMRHASQWSSERLQAQLAPRGELRVARDGAAQASAWTREVARGISRITLYDPCFDGASGRFTDLRAYALGTIVHELAHAWDFAHGLHLSHRMLLKTGGRYANTAAGLRYLPAGRGRGHGTTQAGHDSHEDDFAESVTVFIIGVHYDDYQGLLVDDTRLEYIRVLMQCPPTAASTDGRMSEHLGDADIVSESGHE